ncbi:fumarylacetoacetase, partial [Ideonella sp.]|uniref:fumarylacetoacetase n=1 Tax=Ideonella sp. TaxID=1929293 RepID=UPI002B47FF42
YGCFRARGEDEEAWRLGVAIGDEVLDLRAAIDAGLGLEPMLGTHALEHFMLLPAARWRDTRRTLSQALAEGSAHRAVLRDCLLPQRDVELTRPCRIGDYTDFYTGIHHATAVGRLFRPDQPLLPNYKWVPIGYHGRSSSIRVSGHAFRRPKGQAAGEAGVPRFGPSQRLDYELELGVFVGGVNTLGTPRNMAQAEDEWFGVVLLNDWSARDLQAWEYQPLGPFLSKNFATTISPWIVTRDALAPFRAPFARPEGDPEPLPHLDSPANRDRGAIELTLEVWLQTSSMKAPQRLSCSNFRDAYWTIAQLIAHHSSNGCNLQPGDLLGSGTQSGPREGEGGSLLELSHGGKQPITLSNGETRTFLQDGDTVILRGHAEREGCRRIGLGECRATVLPALA